MSDMQDETPRAFEVRATDGAVISSHAAIEDALYANRNDNRGSRVWCGCVAMTYAKTGPKGSGGWISPERLGVQRVRGGAGHRRYDPTEWQDPKGAESLARVVGQ